MNAAVSAVRNLDSIRVTAAVLFRAAVESAMKAQSFDAPRAFENMRELIPDPDAFGFACRADADAAIIPTADSLTWFAWSTETFETHTYTITVRVRAFHLIGHGVHIEVMTPDRSPLPFTESGYLSRFLPFAAVADYATPKALIAEMFPDHPIQRGLF